MGGRASWRGFHIYTLPQFFKFRFWDSFLNKTENLHPSQLFPIFPPFLNNKFQQS